MVNGISYFLYICDKEAISDKWFCVSEARKDTLVRKAYIYKAGDRLKEYHKYAIKYYPIDDVFLCWNAQIKHRKNFRLMKTKVQETVERNCLSAKKGIEFPWRAKEDVYIFRTKDVEKFLQFLKEKNII